MEWAWDGAIMVETYTDSIRPPNPGNKLGADEKRQDIGGRESCTVMAMDMATTIAQLWDGHLVTVQVKYDHCNTILVSAPCPFPSLLDRC